VDFGVISPKIFSITFGYKIRKRFRQSLQAFPKTDRFFPPKHFLAKKLDFTRFALESSGDFCYYTRALFHSQNPQFPHHVENLVEKLCFCICFGISFILYP